MNGVCIQAEGGRVFISGDLDLKKIHDGILGAKWEKKLVEGRRRWRVHWPFSPHSLRLIHGQLHAYNIQNTCWDKKSRVLLEQSWGYNYLDPDFIPKDPPKTHTKPWDHQKRAFWHVIDRWGGLRQNAAGGAVLWLDMGCGKTKVAIDIINNYSFWRTLIVCPAKVVDVWPGEWEKHGPKNKFHVESLKGSMKKRADIVASRFQAQVLPTVFITNYEAFDRKPVQDAIKNGKFNCIILDEIHRIKDPGGQRSKAIATIGGLIPCRLGLTGTFLPNSPLDAYAQTRFIDATYFGNSFVRFRSEYAIMGGYCVNGKPVQVLGYKNEVDMGQRIKLFAMEIRAEDVQDLPEEHHIDRIFELSAETREKYDQLEKDFVLYLEEAEVTAANVMVKMGKLQEITGGAIRDPDTGKIHKMGTEKKDILVEILKDLPIKEPVVVFARYKTDLLNVHVAVAECGRVSMELSGSRNELKNWTQAHGGEVLVAQISSGKEGIDLTRSHYTFYYSLTYQPGEFNQSKKRQHRPGQKADRVTYFHLIAKKTIDQTIYRAITRKQNVIDAVRKEVRG